MAALQSPAQQRTAAALARIAELLVALSDEVLTVRRALSETPAPPAAGPTAAPPRAAELAPMLTTDEVCDALHVSVNTVYSLITSGELPASKVGRDYRVAADEVRLLLERGRVRPTATRG